MSTVVSQLATQAQNVLTLKGDGTPKPTEPQVRGSPPADYPYKRLLPSYDQGFKLPPLEPFEHHDPGHAALTDPEPQSFLNGAKVGKLSPKFGTEVTGVQLSALGAQEKRYGFTSSHIVVYCLHLVNWLFSLLKEE
jgi:sulfonate dioxygenase